MKKTIKKLAQNKIVASLLLSGLILLGAVFFSAISDTKLIYGASQGPQGCALPDGTNGQTGSPCCTSSQCVSGGTCVGQQGNTPGTCQGGGGATPGPGTGDDDDGEDVVPGPSGGTTIICDLFGSAWSSNIGWVKMNSCDSFGGSCAIPSYKVSILSDDKVEGYAWSNSIGWIKFGGLSDFPNGNGTTGQNAKLSGGNKVKGWVKALSAPSTGPWVNNPSGNADKDWDGWVSLDGNTSNGNTPSYQV